MSARRAYRADDAFGVRSVLQGVDCGQPDQCTDHISADSRGEAGGHRQQNTVSRHRRGAEHPGDHPDRERGPRLVECPHLPAIPNARQDIIRLDAT